jgi:hypothetical protein
MSKELVITVHPGGSVSALHMDEFPLSFLGKMSLRRATEIGFDERSQSFFIELYYEDGSRPYQPPGLLGVATSLKGYDIARKFEVEWLQRCALDGSHPHSMRGVEIAKTLKQEHPDYYV